MRASGFYRGPRIAAAGTLALARRRALAARRTAQVTWRTHTPIAAPAGAPSTDARAARPLRQLHALAAAVRAARRRSGGPVHLRADRLRLPAHRQLPHLPVRGRAEARADGERIRRPPRDEHHGCRAP